MPEIPQATLDALLAKVADLQTNLTAVTSQLSQLSTGESSNKRAKVDTVVRPFDEEMITEPKATEPSNLLLHDFEQYLKPNVSPAASVIELLKTVTPHTDFLTVINIEDPVFRAIAYSHALLDSVNTYSDLKPAVSFFGVKHNGEAQVYDHSKPTHEWRRPMLQVALGHLLTMCPRKGDGNFNISLGVFFNTFEACLLPLATIVTPRGLVQPQTPITETETRNIIFTLYKLLNHYPAKNAAWAKFFKFKERFLGNNTTTVLYPWKQDVMKYFVCLHAFELGLEWNEGYDYADIQFDIRVKYPNTDVEDRLNHLLLSNVKSSAAKPMSKLSKMSCFPTRVEPTGPLIDLKPKVDRTIMFFKNEVGHINMYWKTSDGVYEVIDVLGARLDSTLTYSYPSTGLSSMVQGILPKLEEYWNVEDNDDLWHKLEQILLLLKVFAKCTKDGKDTPLLPPVMSNEIRQAFLVVLYKLMLATKDRLEDWQAFLCKLLTAKQEKTLDGTEYTFVHNDIRFLLLKFVSLYNGEVFSVADVDMSNLKALHSRDNWQTLNQLIQGTFSYSSILSIIVDSFITDDSFDLQVQLQFFKRWINQQPEAAQEHIISNRWEYLSLNGLTFALECIPLFTEKTLQHIVQTSKYVGLTTFMVRFTPKDSMEDVRFVNSVRQFFIDMESTDAKRTFVECMLNLVSKKLNDTKDKNAKKIMDLAYAFGHRV